MGSETGDGTDVLCTLTLQPTGSSMGVLVPDQPPLRAAPAEVPQHPQQLDEHQRDEVGEQVALADAHCMHSPGEGEQQPSQEEVDAVLAAEDLGVFLRVAAAHGRGTGAFLHLPGRRPGAASRRLRFPREAPTPAACPSPIGGRGRSGAAGPPRASPQSRPTGRGPSGGSPAAKGGCEGQESCRGFCGARGVSLALDSANSLVEIRVEEKLRGGGMVRRWPCPSARGRRALRSQLR